MEPWYVVMAIWAAIRKHCRLGGLHTNLFLTVPEAEKPKIQMPSRKVSF